MRLLEYKTKFVPVRPEVIEDGVLYMIPHYNCAIHKCMCGCGDVVVTSIDDNNGLTSGFWGWSFNGKDASLTPSVGNFQFKCRSHYFLQHGKVRWC